MHKNNNPTENNQTHYKMKKQNIFIFSLLILGLLFSATMGFKFDLANGFELKGWWISIPLQIFDFAGQSSNELALNSQLIGYVFYLMFGLASLKKHDLQANTSKFLFVTFFILIGLVFISDFYSFYLDINNEFGGRHFGVGLLVFLLGLGIHFDFPKHRSGASINSE